MNTNLILGHPCLRPVNTGSVYGRCVCRGAAVQAAVSVGGVDRLTDTSKYTGSHKERFDESGKGKGITGREDVKDNTGYVGAYKGAGTYDKSH